MKAQKHPKPFPDSNETKKKSKQILCDTELTLVFDL